MSKKSLKTEPEYTEKGLRLSELTSNIKNAISNALPEHYWVIAEISEIRTNYSGHAYIEFIEKDPVTEKISARMRATIWSYTFRILKPYFENITGYELEAGIKVMVKATVEFHDIYGLSLNVTDIDPAYTLGDLARKKAEIIERLTGEGVIDMNKALSIPPAPVNIAVISSETAAGFGDFRDSLLNNPYSFSYRVELFPSIMQGDDAENSILHSLEMIFEREHEFDIVAIIRGGGAKADLECFNSYEIALHVSQFPLPVLTGIGHERDETVVDLVANKFLKTPTAAAEFIIDKTLNFAERIEEYSHRLAFYSKNILDQNKYLIENASRQLLYLSGSIFEYEKTRLKQFTFTLNSGSKYIASEQKSKMKNFERFILHFSKTILSDQKNKLILLKNELSRSAGNYISDQCDRLSGFEKTNDYLNPNKILKRGFSVTLHNNKVIRDTEELTTGDEIETRLFRGRIISKIKNKS